MYFLFHVLFLFAHSCIFVSPFPEDQLQKETETVINQRTSQLRKWWSNTSDGVVKQKYKEFVKVTIQWNWLAIWSRKKKVFILNFLFHLLFIFAHFWIFVSPFPDDQPQKEVMTVMNQPVDKMVNQYFRWRCELLDNRPIQ